MIVMFLGVVLIFSCCTYGNKLLNGVKSKIEGSAGFPFPPVVYSEAHAGEFILPSPRPGESHSGSEAITTPAPSATPSAPTSTLGDLVSTLLGPKSGLSNPTSPQPDPTSPLLDHPSVLPGLSRTPPRLPARAPLEDPLSSAVGPDSLIKCTTV